MFRTRLLIPADILLRASYIASRVLEHYSIDGLSHVLEIVGAYWVGTFPSSFRSSLFSDLDLCTGFGCGCVRICLRYARSHLSSRW
jgi:hypothetical protein